MIFTIETPGVDGLCGVFINKKHLSNVIIEYLCEEFHAKEEELDEVVKNISTHDFDGAYISCYNDYDCKDYSHELIIDGWPENSQRLL